MPDVGESLNDVKGDTLICDKYNCINLAQSRKKNIIFGEGFKALKLKKKYKHIDIMT